jgi:hypothetical protein
MEEFPSISNTGLGGDEHFASHMGASIWVASLPIHFGHSTCELCELVFDDLQEHPWEVVAAAMEEFFFGGAPRVPILESLGENLRFDLYRLCLAMTF